jgi:predicted GNAT superfamily acetyltransferase
MLQMNDLEKTVADKGRKFLLRVETSHEAGAYQKYEDLRNEIWGFPDDHLAGTRNMMCENFLAEGSSVFIGAFAEAGDGGFPTEGGNLVGFCYGFVGIDDKDIGFRDPRNLRFYSQFAGIRREYQSHGLGIQIKEFQRQVVLNRLGVGTMICTYDPLTGINAHRNIHHFGMEVEEYRVATYGEYGGLLNRSDVASDRLLMTWDLRRKPRAGQTASGPQYAGARRVFVVEERRVNGKGGAVDVEVIRQADLPAEAEILLVQIPLDFYRMLEVTGVAETEVRRIPADWRLHTREAFLSLFGRGYRVVDFLKAESGRPGNFYVLRKSS